jgi:hypothetical protein
MTRFLKLAPVFVLALSLSFPSACSRKESAGPARGTPSVPLKLPPDLTTKPGNTCEVTFTDRVVKMEQRAFLDSIRSISSDNRTFVFDPHDATASRLKQGDILFVPGVAMRKVDVATQQGGYTVIVTEDAALLDAFKDANISWSTPVNFVEAQQQMQAALNPAPPPAFRLLDLVETKAYAQTKLSFSGEDDGWKYTVDATPVSGRLNLQMTVSREWEGIEVKIDGSGYVQNFENVTKLVVKDNQLQELDFKNSDLKGLINFNWEASKKSGGVEAAEFKVKLPSSFSTLLPIGGIPFALEVSEALLIHPAFTGNNEIARGRFRVQYDGTEGFSLKGGNAEQDGQAGGEGSIVEHFSATPLAPVGFVCAVSMPRVELKLGTASVFQFVKQYVPSALADGLVNALKKVPVFGKWMEQKIANKIETNAAAYAQVIISTSTIAAGTATLVPCQRAQLILTIMVGANGKVLGKDVANVDKVVFRQEKKVVVPPTKACEG